MPYRSNYLQPERRADPHHEETALERAQRITTERGLCTHCTNGQAPAQRGPHGEPVGTRTVTCPRCKGSGRSLAARARAWIDRVGRDELPETPEAA